MCLKLYRLFTYLYGQLFTYLYRRLFFLMRDILRKWMCGKLFRLSCVRRDEL